MSRRPLSLLRIVPVSWHEACAFVAEHHRHLRPPQGHKFVVGVAHRDLLVGVVIVGRPIARHNQDGQTLEITRTATDGTRNACSTLYGAAWRAAQALGYTRLITSTQPGEGEAGASLRAAGWRVVAHKPAHAGWHRPSRPRTDHGSAGVRRTLWDVSADVDPDPHATEAAAIAANCCPDCGHDVGPAELARHQGICAGCVVAAEAADLELYGITPAEYIEAVR